jgi:hypothetical protein
MKALAFVPAAIAAILALNISTASSQQACVQEYQVCMNTCGTKPSKSMQDGCFQACEGKNDMCAERVYGRRPTNAPASVAVEQRGPAKDALAKKERPEAAPQEQVADERAPQQQQQQRGPARR